MPAIPGIDFSNWPAWLVFLLLILNLFKAQVAKGWASLFKLKEDQQDHEQDIETNLVDHDLQTKATEQLRESRREDRVWEERKLNSGYLHGYLNGKVDGLQTSLIEGLAKLEAGQEATQLEVAGLRMDLQAHIKAQQATMAQTNNLLNQIHIALSRRGQGN